MTVGGAVLQPSTSQGDEFHNRVDFRLAHFSDGIDHDERLVEEDDVGGAALDLSLVRFSRHQLDGIRLNQLRVVVLAGSCIVPDELALVLSHADRLEKLDASCCSLNAAPSGEFWAKLSSLKVLFLHRNRFARWDDVESVTLVPNLEWLTFFENPIQSQPEFRSLVIERAPQMQAVDYWVITDDERLRFHLSMYNSSRSFQWPVQPPSMSSAGGRRGRTSPVRRLILEDPEPSAPYGATSQTKRARFTAGAEESIVHLQARPPRIQSSPLQLLEVAAHEFSMLRHRVNRCSAACCIQTSWKGYHARKYTLARQTQWMRVITTIQKHARTFLWKRRMVVYLKEYLAEVDQLDLLLSAKEMLQLKARKRIEATLRYWIRKRKDRRKVREAADIITRCARGYLVRMSLMRKELDLQKYRRIYFPERYAWEFLVLLNCCRPRRDLPLLPRDHRFEAADMIGLMVPEAGDTPPRNAAMYQLVSYVQYCLVRPKRCFRNPQCPWDGPFHRLGYKPMASPHMSTPYTKVRRRAANVDNYCRQAFKKSCAPGAHPIDRPAFPIFNAGGTSPPLSEISGIAADDAASSGGNSSDYEDVLPVDPHPGSNGREDEVSSVVLKAFLNGPESQWPKEARQQGSILRSFLLQARKLGPPPRLRRPALQESQKGSTKMQSQSSRSSVNVNYGATEDPETGLRVYRGTNWLAQRMLFYTCESESLALDLISFMLRFRGTGGDAPLVNRIPFIMEKMICEVAAATSMQATWRAHRARGMLSCGLHTAALTRRATLCIQRCWRWSLLKRRLDILVGAKRYVASVKTATVFMEERLFHALNLINSIDRYPPLIDERKLAFGYSGDVDSVVLVRKDLAGGPSLRQREAKGRDAAKHLLKHRVGGLPTWLVRLCSDLQSTGPDDPSLKDVCGLHGLLLANITEPSEDHVVTVATPSLLQAAEDDYSNNPKLYRAAAASSGVFRFVELKFSSLAQAKRRALMIFLCTFCARHRVAVPLFPRTVLHSTSACERILRLWDIFGLAWPSSDRTAVFQLKQKYGRHEDLVVRLCGKDHRRCLARTEWQNGSSSASEDPRNQKSTPSTDVPLNDEGRRTPRLAELDGQRICTPRGDQLTPRTRSAARGEQLPSIQHEIKPYSAKLPPLLANARGCASFGRGAMIAATRNVGIVRSTSTRRRPRDVVPKGYPCPRAC